VLATSRQGARGEGWGRHRKHAKKGVPHPNVRLATHARRQAQQQEASRTARWTCSLTLAISYTFLIEISPATCIANGSMKHGRRTVAGRCSLAAAYRLHAWRLILTRHTPWQACARRCWRGLEWPYLIAGLAGTRFDSCCLLDQVSRLRRLHFVSEGPI
jgi:hypothetical protein